MTLEPVVQLKVKIWQFRLVQQFGYSLAIKSDEDYMKPIFTSGIEFVIRYSNPKKEAVKEWL